ncbi:MAG: RpiB/LacA/LacB family sugar-phosphate isomerase [Candidatus Levybacteria bacterium]|nr:RpiB/LacA/LacB family sugar-phosphate isomerase [Candidatus Levybacteria bacterium]
MKVYLGTDHAGFKLKESIKAFLQQEGHDVVDEGALLFDKTDDYPDFIAKAARSVAANPGSFGIVFGKSGAGEAIVANKIKGIRAVLCFKPENARLAREHNDANVLSLGEGFTQPKEAEEIVKTFLETPFSGEERHRRRIEKIKAIEEGKSWKSKFKNILRS